MGASFGSCNMILFTSHPSTQTEMRQSKLTEMKKTTTTKKISDRLFLVFRKLTNEYACFAYVRLCVHVYALLSGRLLSSYSSSACAPLDYAFSIRYMLKITLSMSAGCLQVSILSFISFFFFTHFFIYCFACFYSRRSWAYGTIDKI